MNTVDAIIVGQGLAGSALAWELLQRDKKVVVFDEPQLNRASKISAGICNPITGRVMSRTYLADRLFPFLNTFYPDAEKILHRRFFHPLPIYRPFISLDEQLQWKEKALSTTLQPFITEVRATPLRPDILNNSFGGLLIAQAGYLDVEAWVTAVRETLIDHQSYRAEYFDEKEMKTGEVIAYKDLSASSIIFCNGLAARKSDWFDWLPLEPLKGETLTVRMKFDANWIVSRGVYIVPAREKDTFVVGSTYQHAPIEERITTEARTHLAARLAAVVSAPFEIIHQDWGIRPTVKDRRPLLGQHPGQRNVIIFNGLGTKGVSLAPYFAKALADGMNNGPGLPEEVNISRFKSLYSR